MGATPVGATSVAIRDRLDRDESPIRFALSWLKPLLQANICRDITPSGDLPTKRGDDSAER